MATHSSSCLENPMDREAWWATVHRVSIKLETQVNMRVCIVTSVVSNSL